MSYLIKDLPEEEKPREKAINNGLDTLSLVELLSIILRTGSKNESVKDLSIRLLNQINGLEGLKHLRLPMLTEIKGIGKTKAITLLASIELGKRMNLESIPQNIKITETKDVYDYYNHLFIDDTQEKFLVLFLNTKNYVINKKIIFIGTANQSLIHPRDIFKEAILNNALKIICVHNHPTGDASPSKKDIMVTKNLIKVGLILGIPLLDHVILGKNSYYSFLERNSDLFK